MALLCIIAVVLAMAGLGAVALALGPIGGIAGSALFVAPALGAGSVAAGLAATVVALRHYG